MGESRLVRCVVLVHGAQYSTVLYSILNDVYVTLEEFLTVY